MSKIIHFPSKQGQSPAEFIQETAEVIMAEGIESIIIAGKNKDGYWVTGYLNADWGTRNEALGHIQADIIDQMILANLDRYVD